MSTEEISKGSAVRIAGSRRKWTVVAFKGGYVRVVSGSAFETRRKTVRAKDVSLWATVTKRKES